MEAANVWVHRPSPSVAWDRGGQEGIPGSLHSDHRFRQRAPSAMHQFHCPQAPKGSQHVMGFYHLPKSNHIHLIMSFWKNYELFFFDVVSLCLMMNMREPGFVLLIFFLPIIHVMVGASCRISNRNRCCHFFFMVTLWILRYRDCMYLSIYLCFDSNCGDIATLQSLRKMINWDGEHENRKLKVLIFRNVVKPSSTLASIFMWTCISMRLP